MYTLVLVFAMSAVVLSPLLLDLLLSFREAQSDQSLSRSRHKKGPHVAWASPRVR